MTNSRKDDRLMWQSKAVVLLVVPWTATSVLLQTQWWMGHELTVVWQALGIGAIFGLIVWRMRAATAGGALTGAAITSNLIFATAQFPYEWTWLHGGLMPLLAVFVLTYAATKIGRTKKERLGTAESRHGRNAAQVAANLGMASLAASFPYGAFQPNQALLASLAATTAFASLAALAEAAADTVSSEIGQVFGGEPRMITTFKRVAKGSDGGITFVGTLAGALASLLVMTVAFSAMKGGDVHNYWVSICLGAIGATFGLLFDSLLGGTLERRGWLNNDAVNFLSTLSAIVFVLVAIAVLSIVLKPH
jgi:uncharacterized protein (TIGR00297 family)